MIPATNTLTHTDTLGEIEEIEFGIGDPRWVMRTQAELYSDVVTAIIREYSTNAYDAHVMAGNPNPIKVTLPSMMNPFFTVEDEGVGMTLDLFRTVYTQFGVSDKRDSTMTNGMLGYGSKSGVAYTNAFTVTSVRDGIKTVGVITRKPDWSIVLKVQAQVRTDEPNGTKIVIPVHNWDEFNHKANEFYKFWLPGRVLVNGKEPAHYVGKKITDNLYYSNEWNRSYVVMGNVAYRIENPDFLFNNSKMNRINFVAYVDDFKTTDGGAAVEFTPSREDLKYTERTKGTLAAIIAEFEDKILVAAEADIAAADTHFEAYSRWADWSTTLGRSLFSELEFNGVAFESSFDISAARYSPQGYGNSVYRIKDWPVDNMARSIIITDYSLALNSKHKAMVRIYARLNGKNASYFLFTNETTINSVWVDQTRVIAWEALKASLPKTPKQTKISGPGRIKGTFDYFTKTDFVEEKELPEDTDIFFIRVQDSKEISTRNLLKMLDCDGAVILLAKNRIDKFTRDNPTAQDFKKWAQSKVVLDASSLLTADCKAGLALGYGSRNWLAALDASKIDDPVWAASAGIMKSHDKNMKPYEDNLALAKACGMGYNVKNTFRDSGQHDSLISRYPLLANINSYTSNKSEIYLYLNAAYAARKDNA